MASSCVFECVLDYWGMKGMKGGMGGEGETVGWRMGSG